MGELPLRSVHEAGLLPHTASQDQPVVRVRVSRIDSVPDRSLEANRKPFSPIWPIMKLRCGFWASTSELIFGLI